MAWDESKAWRKGRNNQKLYQALLDDAATAPARNAKRKKIVHPEDMPWEMSRQGLLKHLLNEGMNTRMETVDAYMEIIPPGSRSGKHRHLAEECVYVLEGHGYDLHQDCDVEITDTYHWKPQAEVKRYEWEAGDVIYIPSSTIHQHFNADPRRPGRIRKEVCDRKRHAVRALGAKRRAGHHRRALRCEPAHRRAEALGTAGRIRRLSQSRRLADFERLLRVRNPGGGEARAAAAAVRGNDLRTGRPRLDDGVERRRPAHHLRMEGGFAVCDPPQRLAPAFQRIRQGARALRGRDQRARGHQPL